MTAREQILARVRAATADVAAPRGSARPGPVESGDAAHTDTVAHTHTVERFVATVTDYRAEVVRVPHAEAGLAVTEALRRHACASAVAPAGLPEDWLAATTAAARTVVDDGRLTPSELDAIDAVVTGAALGIARTGTIVLDHGADQGRRAITLVPDTHVCVVRSQQLVPDVPDAVRALRPAVVDGRPLTWVSGPSATSDIELQRVEGVHGPRTLVVILVDDLVDDADTLAARSDPPDRDDAVPNEEDRL